MKACKVLAANDPTSYLYRDSLTTVAKFNIAIGRVETAEEYYLKATNVPKYGNSSYSLQTVVEFYSSVWRKDAAERIQAASLFQQDSQHNTWILQSLRSATS